MTPTHTSYAVLGLLSVRPWTAYELARQSDRSLRWFFPRAERAVYLEAKRLVALGWASAVKTATGRRASTVYTITTAGERALREWLGAPSGPTEVVSEGALKMFFADRASTAEMAATIAGIGDHAAQALDELAALAGGDSPFPERIRTNVLSMRLIADIHRAMHDWASWAADAVAVLDSGDDAAIEAQTRHVLDTVRAPHDGELTATSDDVP